MDPVKKTCLACHFMVRYGIKTSYWSTSTQWILLLEEIMIACLFSHHIHRFFSNSVNKKREKLSVRKSAVDPAGFISFTVQYIEGVWGTSAAIKNREATKTTFPIRKDINLTTSKNLNSRLSPHSAPITYSRKHCQRQVDRKYKILHDNGLLIQ